MGVQKIVISRECSLEEEVDNTVSVLVESRPSSYEIFNSIQEFLSQNVYENIEVIPYDSLLAKIDDHFDEDATVIDLT